MLGAIAGDIAGSVYERTPVKTKDFPLFGEHSRFTDDTVLTVAVAHAILREVDYATSLKEFARRYPNAGYGYSFYQWMLSDANVSYNSWGNGSAMRVSPVGFAFDSQEKVLIEARKSAEVTHNHPEGIKGAQATALAIYMARHGTDKKTMKAELGSRFLYDLDRAVEEVRPGYCFDVSCQGSVPESLIAFFESRNFEDAIRKAISFGGDSDTMACIAGGIAQAYYKGLHDVIVSEVRTRLPREFLLIIDEFNERFGL